MKKEIKIGIFVVTVIVLSFFVLNYLRGVDIFNREITLVSEYDNVEGLVASAPVYIKGYKAGKVSEVSYDSEDGHFVVSCSVSKSFNIPSDSKMTIYSVDVMGGKGIRIDLGTSDVPAADGAFLEPAFEAGMIDGLASAAIPVLDKVALTLDSLQVTVSGINSILSESNKENISMMLADLEATTGNLRSLTSSINGKSPQISELVDNLASLSTGLQSLPVKLDSTLTVVNGLVTSLDESDIEGAVSSFRSLMDNLNDPDGSIGKLMQEDNVYNSVDSLLNDINILVRKIQENPRKYLKISVF